MNDCENFKETSLLEKEDFYSHLHMEDATNADYAHEIKNLRKYHDLYVQRDMSLVVW